MIMLIMEEKTIMIMMGVIKTSIIRMLSSMVMIMVVMRITVISVMILIILILAIRLMIS